MTSPAIRFEEWERYNDEQVLEMFDGDVQLGSIQFYAPHGEEQDWEDRYLSVYNMTVLEEHRGQGFAVQMVDEMVRRYPAPSLSLDQGTVSAVAVVHAWFRSKGQQPVTDGDSLTDFELPYTSAWDDIPLWHQWKQWNQARA